METAPPRLGLAVRLRGLGADLRAALGSGLRLARDAALPAQCLACRAPVQDDGLCPACWAKLSFIAPPYCERLGIPFAYDPGPGVLSPAAIADPPAYRRARAAVRYDDVARALVHALKFHDRTDLAPAMGRWMAQAGRTLTAEADALVPVPLHWRRSLSRRYNQAALLALAVGREAPRLPVLHEGLTRARATAHQVGLSRAERARNVQGAFRVPEAQKPLVRGRRLVLVDDILTTGATLEACARALTRAGAARVDVLVFARVVDSA